MEQPLIKHLSLFCCANLELVVKPHAMSKYACDLVPSDFEIKLDKGWVSIPQDKKKRVRIAEFTIGAKEELT